MLPAVIVAQGIKKQGHKSSSSRRDNNNTGRTMSKVPSMYTSLPPGEYNRGMVNYNKKEEELKAHIITNKIQAEIDAVVQPQVTLFRQEKIAEIEAKSESDLKTLLQSYRNPTPLVNRVKKSIKRTLRMRTGNNSRRELIELAKQIYLPSVVGEYKRRLESQERQAAVGRLTPAEKIRLDEETDYIAHERAGIYTRATIGYGVSPYEWITEQNVADRMAEMYGGRKRKTRRNRM